MGDGSSPRGIPPHTPRCTQPLCQHGGDTQPPGLGTQGTAPAPHPLPVLCGAAVGTGPSLVGHVLRADAAPNSHHESLHLALVDAAGDAKVAALAPRRAPRVGRRLQRGQGTLSAWWHPPDTHMGAGKRQHPMAELPQINLQHSPSIFGSGHQAAAPLPTCSRTGQ